MQITSEWWRTKSARAAPHKGSYIKYIKPLNVTLLVCIHARYWNWNLLLSWVQNIAGKRHLIQKIFQYITKIIFRFILPIALIQPIHNLTRIIRCNQYLQSIRMALKVSKDILFVIGFVSEAVNIRISNAVYRGEVT